MLNAVTSNVKGYLVSFNKKVTIGNIEIADLIPMEDPEKVLREVKIIISMEYPEFDFKPLYHCFYDIVRLFNGEYSGFQKCNTNYHDLKHTTDTLLAMMRLIHGYNFKNKRLSEKNITLGLISVIMHDTGYIQTIDDTFGTGAKYTTEHIPRSIHFTENYFEEHNYSKEDFIFCKNCISCSGINAQTKDINFSSHEEEIIGKILGIADLLGQMSDRDYLEKLLFLYYEFKEGNILGFESEFDLLDKSLTFFDITKERFKNQFDNIERFMIYHFKSRWNIDSDLYSEGIAKNIEYLKFIMEKHRKDYLEKLKRGGVVKKLQLL